jgi:hypothetical protein
MGYYHAQKYITKTNVCTYVRECKKFLATQILHLNLEILYTMLLKFNYITG